MPETPLVMDFSMTLPTTADLPAPIYLSPSFWSYEYCKRLTAAEDDSSHQIAMKVLLCGGIAGIATWASVFPLDMLKTRLQAQTMSDRLPGGTHPEGRQPLLESQSPKTLNTFQIAKEVYRTEGMRVFYRGLGVCSVRAFIVNAVQVCPYPLDGRC